MNILVVEDEVVVRNVVVRVLRRTGHYVLEAASGEEAATIGAAFRDCIHLVLLDHTLGRENAGEIARLLQAHRCARVLYTSGHPRERLLAEGSLRETDWFLQKPFRPAALIDTVRRVLDD